MMNRFKWTLLALLLLPLVAGCVQVRQVTPAPSAPPLVVGITVEATTTPSPTATNALATPTNTPIPQPTSTSTPTSVPPTATSEPPTSTPRLPTPMPVPPTSPVEPGITIVGTVMDVSLSARVIMLTEPVEGFGVVALTEESKLVSADGGEMALHEIRPGMRIQASGQPGESGALLANLVLVFEAEPIRIQFEPGATSATVSGYIETHDVDRYVLRALAGQTMEVIITSPNNDVLLTIVGADGIPLKRYVDGTAQWRGELPSTQDYFIEAVSVGGATSYELSVWISALGPSEPIRIQFAPGTTSATMTGHLEQQYDADLYVLRALVGQTMEVTVTSPGNGVGLSIWGTDGTPLKRYAVGAAQWRGVLPSTQDYFIEAIALGGATSYEMTVWVSALGPSEPIRIQFAPGATSATVEGSLEPGGFDRYVLCAMRGQMMEVRVSPAPAVAISVQGQDGSFWSVPSSEGTLRIEQLPATQDYTITLAAVPPTGTTYYTMVVRIPPPL